MSLRHQVKQLLRMFGHALVSTVHERLNHTDRQLDIVIDQNNALARTQTALLQALIHIVESNRGQLKSAAEVTHLHEAATEADTFTREGIKEQLDHQIVVETSDYGFAHPEVGLMSFLYSLLPSRRVLDIGARLGEFSERLLDTGYEVYAFEPSETASEKLAERFRGNTEFHGHNLAIGGPMHTATDEEPTTSPVKTLANLHRLGTVPDDIAMVRIDTGGHDLEVIRGMEHHRYPVVAATPCGRRYTLESMVQEMRDRGYRWHIVLYRIGDRDQTVFYANHPRAIAHSSGSVFFFRDLDLFQQAHSWCAAVLSRTYFKSVPTDRKASD